MLRSFRCSLLTLAFCVVAGAAYAQDVVAVRAKRIDGEIAKRLQEKKIPASPLADDAEFLRRVTLDLTGQIPSYERTTTFLADRDPKRRAKLIDELLESPEFGKHFAVILSQLLLGTEIAAPQREIFKGWLAAEINKGQTWDKLVHAMITAEGEAKTNPAAVFVLAQTDDNKLMPNLMAASTTRYFLGVQLQCAECHNHPFTNWKQTEFWGMAAFFAKVKVATPKKGQSDGPVGLTESFAATDPKKKGPAAVKSASITIPATAGKSVGKVVKAKFLEAGEPVLDVERPFRPALANWVTSPENKYFARAAVNRLWFVLFGRGIVNPVDDMHADNEPTHPELLQALADDFKASSFNLKHFVRCVCNSEAYQRTSRPVKGNEDDRDGFSHMAVKVMGPEVLYDALTRALGVKELNVTTGKIATTGKGGAAKTSAGNNRDKFIKFFKTQDADSLPTDFTHGIPQVLNLMNDPQFNKGGPVVDRIIAAKLPRDEAVERLYLTVLSRRPNSDESKRLSRYLDGEPDPARGYASVLWALINSPEFILNH